VWSIEVEFWEENLVRSYCFSLVSPFNAPFTPFQNKKKISIKGRKGKETDLIRHNIPMPSNQIIRTVILYNGVVPPIHLIHHRPLHMQLLINVRHGIQKIPRIRQPMPTQGSQIRQLPHAAPNLRDVPPGILTPLRQPHTKPHPPLHHEDLARLEVHSPELGLDVEIPLLRAEQEIPVGVAEGAPRHGGVEQVHVQRDAVAEVGVPGAGERVQAVDEIGGGGRRRDWEGGPFCLLGEEVHGGVGGEEAVFYVGS
jgi:hypothetical protein